MAKLEELMPFPAVFHTLFCPALLCAVQPYLERWVQVWAPQCKKDINYERAFKGGLWRWRRAGTASSQSFHHEAAHDAGSWA